MFGSKLLRKFAASVVAPIAVAAVVVIGSPTVALGSSALPIVYSFTATKTSVPNSGGTFDLKARLKYASSCKITVKPGVTGWPKSFTCSSDSVTEAVKLPINKGQNPVTYTFSMVVKNAVGSTPATNVVVTEGAAPPPISFSPTTLTFAPEGVFVGDNPLIETVTNNSSTTQIITSVVMSSVGDPGDFNLQSNNCSYITAHENCSFAVQFRPTGAGNRTAAMSVTDASWGSAGTTVHLPLDGTGIWAIATLANTNIAGNILYYPNQGVATQSPDQYITVSNAGVVPLYIGTITTVGGEVLDFDVDYSNCPQIVSVGQSCTFGVSFKPLGSGLRTTYAVVTDNTLATDTQLQLQGTGVYSGTTLQINGDTPAPSPISFDFGPTAVASGLHATLTITNTSSIDLEFNGVYSSGVDSAEFSISVTQTCAAASTELAPGQSCSVTMNFGPQGQGTRSATLHVLDNSPTGGETVNVTGTGT